jgi:predicted ATPase
VKFLCSAEVEPQNLFSIGEDVGDKNGPFLGEEELFMFARAVSRITEMQSEEYLQARHVTTEQK